MVFGSLQDMKIGSSVADTIGQKAETVTYGKGCDISCRQSTDILNQDSDLMDRQTEIIKTATLRMTD